MYGTEFANILLLRIFIIERTLKLNEYETITTNEYFFLLYVIFRKLLKHISGMNIENILELTCYIVYSYFGPDIEYPIKLFIPVSKIYNWSTILTKLTMETTLPQLLLRLNNDMEYYHKELEQFLMPQ